MKNIITYSCALLLLTASCNSNGGDSNQNDNQPKVENKFSSASEAFAQAQKNIPLLLNENQKRTFGLTDESIKNLTKTNEVPITYLSMNKLGDSAIGGMDDGMLYALGDGQMPKICVSVHRNGGDWMQSSIGMKKFVNTFLLFPGTTRIIDVPGLEMTFAEMKNADGAVVYSPIMDYPDAGIGKRQQFTSAELLKNLEAYRVQLERTYGKEFTSGNLER